MATETPDNVEDSQIDPGVTADAERQALIERTQARLDAVPGIEPGAVGDKPEDKPVVEPTEEAPVEEAPVVEPTVEAPAEEAVEAGDEDPAEPTLPSAYRRSLKAYGNWTDEEIDVHFKASPDKFLEMAGKIHHNRNAETAGYAEAGRRVRADAVQSGADSGTTDKKPQASTVVKPVDVDAMIQQHGNEDLVRELTTPVNAAIEQVNALLPQLQESADEVKQARVETLGKQIETFFTGKELEPYTEVYGDITKTALTSVQQESRNKVLELADAISVGASLQGRQLTVDECLLMAHDNVAGDFKAKAIRKELKEKTKKRAKGTIVKPSHGGKAPASGAPTTRKQLEDKAAVGLKRIFG